MKRPPTMFPAPVYVDERSKPIQPIGGLVSGIMARLEAGRREVAALADKNRKASLIAQEAIERAMETAGDK